MMSSDSAATTVRVAAEPLSVTVFVMAEGKGTTTLRLDLPALDDLMSKLARAKEAATLMAKK